MSIRIRFRFMLPMLLLILCGGPGGCTTGGRSATPPFDPAATTDAWVTSWNTYDLGAVDSLFLPDGGVTYFSSEKEGLIQGIDAVREHHEGFGFVPGGKEPGNRLWLEDVITRRFDRVTVVAAVWLFQRVGEFEQAAQRGPVTFIWVPWQDGWRIAHVNFGNYPSQAPD